MLAKGMRLQQVSRKKRLVFGKALLSVAVAVGCLYAANVGLWLYDPMTWLPPKDTRNTRNVVLTTWGCPVVNNSLGYREREIGAKSYGVKRVMVLGDSLTWGTGMDPCDRWTDRLQRILGPGYEVLNFAVSGDSTAKELVRLINLRPIVQPDIVIVGFCCNDVQPRPESWCPEKDAFDWRWNPTLSRWQARSSRVRLRHLWDALEKAIRYCSYPDTMMALDRCYDPNSPQWKAFVAALGEIKHSEPNAIFASLISFRYANPMVQKWHWQAEGVARGLGFDVVLFNLFGKPWRSLMLNRADGHPSIRLQEIYAEGVSRALSDVVITQTEDQRRCLKKMLKSS